MIEFQFIDHPDQQYSLSINDQRVTIRMLYSQSTDRWSFDLAVDDNWVVYGRKVVEGVDLLETLDLDLGAIFALSDGHIEPNRNAIASGNMKLYSATLGEIDAAMAT